MQVGGKMLSGDLLSCSPLAFRKSLGITMKARIRITLKNGVLDPQGKAIESALGSLGIGGIDDVRQGKFIEVELAEKDVAKARATVERMCKELLANPVIENYAFDLES